MERNIHKQIKLNCREARQLSEKADKACLSESALIRLLIQGYEPREKPDNRFYEFTKRLNAVADNLQRIADVAYATGNIDKEDYESEVEGLHSFIAAMEKKLLENDKADEWR